MLQKVKGLMRKRSGAAARLQRALSTKSLRSESPPSHKTPLSGSEQRTFLMEAPVQFSSVSSIISICKKTRHMVSAVDETSNWKDFFVELSSRSNRKKLCAKCVVTLGIEYISFIVCKGSSSYMQMRKSSFGFDELVRQKKIFKRASFQCQEYKEIRGKGLYTCAILM